MLDFSHIPKGYAGAADQQIFIGTNTSIVGASQQWLKPRGISMIQILCLGQGGNGGAGAIGATALGGTGGGSGAQSALLIPAAFIPDVLYIQAGAGGAGTAIASIVATRPHGATAASIPLPQDTFLIAGGAIGNAVTAGAVGTIATAILSGKGMATFLAGIAGGAAGAITGTAGAAVAANTTGLLVSGGGGGGGMSAAAAAAGGAAFTTAMTSGYTGAGGGTAGASAVNGGQGNNGVVDLSRLVFGGGGGGGAGFPAVTVSAPGTGGGGGFGCGGGGGGGGVTGQTIAVGGRGGAGLVIVNCW
jgi:hypothetical protein